MAKRNMIKVTTTQAGSNIPINLPDMATARANSRRVRRLLKRGYSIREAVAGVPSNVDNEGDKE